MLAGGCICGSVRYQCGPAVLSYKCHCLDCQRASGSAFVALFWSLSDQFSFRSGEPHFHHMTLDSGRKISRGFCPSCGSPVVAKLSSLPQVIGVIAASLDDPSQYTPQYETWTSRAQSWDLLDPSLESLSENFTLEIVRRHLASRGPAA